MSWPRDGVPANPAGWLLTVGRRRAIDAFRRRAARDERYAAARPRPRREADAGRRMPAVRPRPDRRRRAGADVHLLPPGALAEARVALTLRVVGGLTSDEIARAFLVPTADRPGPDHPGQEDAGRRAGAVRGADRDERRERLGSVLSVLYLIFTEGSSARPAASLDPHRPGRRGAPAGPGAGAAGARRARGARPARAAGADRRAVPGPHSTRRRAGAAGGPGPPAVGPVGDPARPGGAGPGRRVRPRARAPTGCRPSIAECHAVAPSVEETDWERIVLLYEALGRLAPSPSSSSTGRSRWRWRSGPAAALRTGRRDRGPRASSPARTCCRPSAASCSPGSAGARRRSPPCNRPSRCARMRPSEERSNARSTSWAAIRAGTGDGVRSLGPYRDDAGRPIVVLTQPEGKERRCSPCRLAIRSGTTRP